MRVLVVLALVLLLGAASLAGYFWYALVKPYGLYASGGMFVEVPRGASERAVARLLEQEGVIRSARAFELYARRHRRRALEAGEYWFDHPLTGKEVFWKLANGEVYQQPFTVHEGDTLFDIAGNLEASGLLPAAEFLRAASDGSQIQDLAPGAKSLEGFLFPATYPLPRRLPAAEVTSKMVRKFRSTLDELAGGHGNTPVTGTRLLEIVTLASLVEAETPKGEERPLVAGVYTNRLHKNMLLQCDPTVVYALKQKGEYHPPLSLNDLRTPSPYNTYLHDGLPPGPIGNPGRASLEAALEPASTPYLYFVANTQGGHFFAATLAEHTRNVAKYHRLLDAEPGEPSGRVAGRTSPSSAAHKGKK